MAAVKAASSPARNTRCIRTESVKSVPATCAPAFWATWSTCSYCGYATRHLDRHHTGHLHEQPLGARVLHNSLSGRRVRAHEPSRPQQRPTEIPRRHAADVFQPGPTQHLERRADRSCAEVLRHRSPARVRPPNPRRHVVPRIIMLRANRRLMRGGLFLGLHMHQLRDKPAFTVHELPASLNPSPQSDVTLHAAPLSTKIPSQPTINQEDGAFATAKAPSPPGRRRHHATTPNPILESAKGNEAGLWSGFRDSAGRRPRTSENPTMGPHRFVPLSYSSSQCCQRRRRRARRCRRSTPGRCRSHAR